MFLNFSYDAQNWQTYWCEVNGIFLDFYNIKENTNTKEIFTSIHLLCYDIIPSSSISQPDIMEIVGTKNHCKDFRIFFYSHETYNLIALLERVKAAQKQWSSLSKVYFEFSVQVRQKAILSLRQKWSIIKNELIIEKTTDKLHIDLRDIEILYPIISVEYHFAIKFKSKKMEEVTIQKLQNTTNIKDFFNAFYNNFSVYGF